MGEDSRKKVLLRSKCKGKLIEVRRLESSAYLVSCFQLFLGFSLLRVKRTFTTLGEVQQFIFTWESELA